MSRMINMCKFFYLTYFSALIGSTSFLNCSVALAQGLIDPFAPIQVPAGPDIDRLLDESRARMDAMIGNIKSQTAVPQAPPAIAYINNATGQLYVGDTIFMIEDHELAKSTWGKYNTKRPVGPGWEVYIDAFYFDYMAMVNGRAIKNVEQDSVYINCVIDKSEGIAESAMREVRASCREIAKNPSAYDQWRWGG